MTSFSLAHLTVLNLPPPEMIRVAARTGYHYVGLRMIAVTDTTPGYPLMHEPAMMRDTKAALADTGVRVLDIEFVKITPEIDVAGLERFVAAGAELGAEHVITAPYDPDLARLADRLGAITDLSARYGLRAGCCNGLQLLIHSASNGHGRYRVSHDWNHPTFIIRFRPHRPSISSVIDLRNRPQLIWRRGSKPKKLQISGNLFEQHVGADLKFAAARAYRGKEGRNLVLHHHFADECRRCNAGDVHRQRVAVFHAEWRSIDDDIVTGWVERAAGNFQVRIVGAQTFGETVHHRRIGIEQRKLRHASLGERC